MAKSGDFDAVFCGHNHIFHIEKLDNCLIVNPWEISAHKSWKATFAVYNTTTNEAEIIELKGIISVSTTESEDLIKKNNIKFSKTKSHQY
jgi:predicted phosphodiesterase